ncbi:MAG: CehA/McbA family metallohydrolase [Bryobacteraceae bacterium]
MALRRVQFALLFGLALAWAQFRGSGQAELAGHLELAIEPRMPARVYLFKDGQPFRLSPVEALMPLKIDLFYRERLWHSGKSTNTLEVTANDQSHFFLLKGGATFDLPAGKYRVEAYRGLFFTPASAEFELKAGETRRVALKLENWTGENAGAWLSGDDHIHLTRAPEDDAVYLGWLEAEDLSVGNFLQLQRQMDAAVQYGFGPKAEARKPGYSIRSGHESRTDFYGHINLLGGREMVRPLSAGTMYANTAEAFPYPAMLFAKGRAVGATAGFAHFNGSRAHSTLLMDLALGNIDFVEVFQFGVLKTAEWYELLNAGLRFTGVAGSDFPVPLNRAKAWPRYIPLLGPERTLVRPSGSGSPYEMWARGVKEGRVVLTNGPVVEVTVDRANHTARATARFFRPIERLDIVVNGEAVASGKGGGVVTATLPGDRSVWVAAHAIGKRESGEPEIQGHTNPVYVERAGRLAIVPAAREAVAKRWAAELDYYRGAALVFPAGETEKFLALGEKALAKLREP